MPGETNFNGDEWQLAFGLLTGMDVGGDEWQLAVSRLSGLNVGSNEWQIALGLLNRTDLPLRVT